MQITGIILAGGKSQRMGTDKALLEVDGQTLLSRAVGFCQLFCNEVLISSNYEAHKVEGIQPIPDETKNCGPMGGIYSCLKHSKNEWNFVLSVDAPFVEVEFVRFLISHAGNFDAVVPFHQKGKEPLVALYHKNAIAAMLQQLSSGEYKMHFLLEKITTRFVDSQSWVEKFPRLFYNLNSPADF
ncbi:MAG: molybdenum cofactor guanylyltransferase [Prolixibacteraceae bacterium]|nr:molybdenum cofactor guanylyltransferase [Prolixibacteraceae bacterium]